MTRRIAVLALLVLLACMALAAVSGAFVQHESDDTHAGTSAIAESVPSPSPRLSHPSVVRLPLRRSRGVARKALFRARAGSKSYQRLLAANAHGAQLNAKKHQREMAALERHMQLLATGDANATTAPPPTVTPMLGCPFSDFTAPVSIGSGVFDLLIDTGSSTLALAGSSCTTCISEGVSPTWAASSSSVDQGATTSGTYGDQSGWVGRIWRDDVAVVAVDETTGATTPVTDTAAMRLVVITSQSTPGYTAYGTRNADAGYFFTKDACNDHATHGTGVMLQGIMGLGFQRLASDGTDSFPAMLWDQRTGDARNQPRMFSIQMCENSGALWFGGYDASSFTGDIVWTPIIPSNEATATYWSVDPSDVLVGGQSLGFGVNDWPRLGGSFNIIDSGTTLWELPTKIFNAVRDRLLADAVFSRYFRSAPNDNFFDQVGDYCEVAADSRGNRVSGATLQKTLPTISIRFANGATLTMDVVGSVLLPCNKDYNQWTLGIAPSDGGLLGGWPLMNQFISIHDVDNMRIGFAVQSSCTTSLPVVSAAVTMGDSVPPGGQGDAGGDTDSLGAATPTAASATLASVVAIATTAFFAFFARV